MPVLARAVVTLVKCGISVHRTTPPHRVYELGLLLPKSMQIEDEVEAAQVEAMAHLSQVKEMEISRLGRGGTEWARCSNPQHRVHCIGRSHSCQWELRGMIFLGSLVESGSFRRRSN